ncbi:hypothetical protein O7634_24685 [Micromonospora sp. WMMD1120]|uniref:hypothetical protein n=1 Tax=Micromonospora sp. WMMD1120 TaxID=3016106 RepID=UPI0024159BC2|nr:hypothetical protein [Micromonospora sp. WMMD1120]MDG4809961.1 hypothetical protein [Micromonospora sp. WMMD1120]
MSGKVAADIVRLERRDKRLRLGDIARALRGWSRQARGPASDLLDEFGGCPCGCTSHHRHVLDLALRALPRRTARELRSVVEAADDRFLSRTLANPWADPSAPWWQQRL